MIFKFSALSQIWKKYILKLNAWDLSLKLICPSICLSVCHKNFNLTHIFSSINDRALIFGMHDPCEVKAGDIKTHSSIHLSVCLSVTKTLTWLISYEVSVIEHWYLACKILVTSPFNWHHAVTLTYFKVKVVAGRGTTILRICLLSLIKKLE